MVAARARRQKPLDQLPIFLKLTDASCLIVGGGVVAARKAGLLLEAGAKVTINAPLTDAALRKLAEGDSLTIVTGKFDPALISRHDLIVAASDDQAVNARVAELARREKRWCNVVDDAALSAFFFPAVVDRAPVTVAISTGGRAPVLARIIKGRLERTLPSRLGSLARLAGLWRGIVKRRLRSIDLRRRFWESVLEGAVARLVLTNRPEQAHEAFVHKLENWSSGGSDDRGEAYLIGAGPGDPGLLTLRGLQLLRNADVVLYDRLVSPEILGYARREAELIAVGKQPGKPSTSQEEINDLLVRHVRAGRRVCRLKGGDPLVFGRGGEELEALAAADLPYQVVPGISAATGCAAYAGIPLTRRGVSQSVTLVTGQCADSPDDLDWAGLALSGGTLAFYMSVARYADIASGLPAHGMPISTPIAIVERGTSDQQRVIAGTLETLAALAEQHDIQAPAMLFVGETAAYASQLHWFGHLMGEPGNDFELRRSA